jgi:hypothetical protein
MCSWSLLVPLDAHLRHVFKKRLSCASQVLTCGSFAPPGEHDRASRQSSRRENSPHPSRNAPHAERASNISTAHGRARKVAWFASFPAVNSLLMAMHDVTPWTGWHLAVSRMVRVTKAAPDTRWASCCWVVQARPPPGHGTTCSRSCRLLSRPMSPREGNLASLVVSRGPLRGTTDGVRGYV